MKILIVGGGIAGTALAYFLQKNHEVTIIEKAPAWRTIGYGIGIWRNGLRILEQLPLNQKFWDSGYAVAQGATLSAAGQPLFQMQFVTNHYDQPIAFTFEREILHKSIHELLTKVDIRFNTDIASIASTVNPKVIFNNGSEETYDLVVGADGIRSKVRSMVFGNKLKPYGWNIWGAWVPKDTQPFPGYYIMGGPRESIISFPYHDKHAIGMMYKADPSQRARLPKNREEIFEHFPTLKPRIMDMIQSIDSTEKMFGDTLQYVQMNEWHSNRVVLIGDARHGMSPLTGLGTSLALEDALVLAEELNINTDTAMALNIFTKRRNKRLQSISLFKNIVENLGMTNSSFGQKIRSMGLKLMPNAFPPYLFEKIFNQKV